MTGVRKLNVVYMIIAAIFASSAAAVSQPKLADEQIIRLGNGSEPKELDPARATGSPEGNILDSLFEGLVSLDPFTLKPVPGMAESWKLSEDGTVYTFKIRKDAKWSDGKALTAEDFVWSWTRALSPTTASEYAYQLYYIKNGKAFNTGKIKDAKKLGVKAQDKQTLIVTLENPTPFFLRLCAFRTLYPTPRHMVEKYPNQEWTKPGKMVSNGPFKLSDWQINRHVELVPNEMYWDRDVIKAKKVYLMPIEQIDTEEKTFFAGQLHATYEVPNLKIPAYKKQMKRNPNAYHPYQSNPYLGSYYYRFNTKKPPLDNPKVRRALSLAIDRTLIVERVQRGGQLPATNFTPPNTGGYTFAGNLPKKVTPEVLKEAKRLLKEAGYENGKGMPKIEILYNTSENHKKVALAISQMWKKNLGIEAVLFNQEWKVYLDNQTKGNYTVSRAGWIGDYPDPNTFLDMWLTGGGNNLTGWSNKTYDELIAKAQATADQDKRFEILMSAEKILMEELPIMPIYFYTRNRLVSKNLKMVTSEGKVVNWTPNIEDRLFLKHFALAK